MDAERRLWLEKLASACERALASDGGERADDAHRELLEGVAELLARIRAELSAANG